MKTYNSNSLTRFCATICKAIGIDSPACAEPAIDWVSEALGDLCKEGFDRVLIHNPDAVGQFLYEKYPDAFEPVLKHTHITVPFKTVMPSVTPVCFGTMYTGAMPAVHGIQKYEKPIIQIDTFFDALIRAGKKVAIVSTQNASMSKIFLEKGVDLYKFDTEPEIVAKAQELIIEDKYDVLCIYTYTYDSLDHRYGPEARESLNALYNQGIFFDTLVSCVKRNWKQHNTLISFSPDHGAHEVIDGSAGLHKCGEPKKGTHGTDLPQDLNILHYLGVVLRSE